MVKLVILSEGFTGTTYELKAERTTIGRLDDNAFCIVEASVSSHHCEVHLRNEEVLVKDLDSTNGTFIQGSQIKEAMLKPGQILRLGNVQMRLESDQPAATAAKRAIDHTMVLPQGVKLNELETGEGKKPDFGADSAFTKKSNKTTLIFVGLGILLGLVIIGLLIYAFRRLNQP